MSIDLEQIPATTPDGPPDDTNSANRSAEVDTTPPPSRSWTSWLAILLIVAAAVVGGRYLVDQRTRPATTMKLGSVVLNAQQIPIGPGDVATVSSVQVAVGDVLTAGETIAHILYPAGAGTPAHTALLPAPTDGVVVSIDAPAGSVVRSGLPVVTEYSSASLDFIAPVAVKRAQNLRLGMSVSVDGPGLSDPIAATVGAVQASLNGNQPNIVNVILTPKRVADVRDLVPGLAFQATVNLVDYPRGASTVLRGGR
jgi:hypothetical protein